jgi:hypothetical protein
MGFPHKIGIRESRAADSSSTQPASQTADDFAKKPVPGKAEVGLRSSFAVSEPHR